MAPITNRAIVLCLSVALLATTRLAWSCPCVKNTPHDDHGRRKRYDVVFLGTALKWTCVEPEAELIVSVLHQPPCRLYQGEFSIAAVWKGSLVGNVTVNPGGADCGAEFEPGQTYLVFGSIRKDRPLEVSTGLCAGSHKSSLEEALRTLGKPRKSPK